MKNGYKNGKEFTSTSPSNRYLGHYKSLLTSDIAAPNSPTKSFSETMWHIFTSLTNFFIHKTQLLERWITTIAIILEKDKGSVKNKPTTCYRWIWDKIQSSIKTILAEINNTTCETRRDVRKKSTGNTTKQKFEQYMCHKWVNSGRISHSEIHTNHGTKRCISMLW